MLKKLITFGCSWTYGIGVGYTDSMTKKEYDKINNDKTINDEFSFRGILSKKLNLKNLNFSHGSSSNQRQFRFAREYFTSDEFISSNKDEILVIWCITSTARNEFWSNLNNDYLNFKYDVNPSKLSMMLLKETYDHDQEVKTLTENILIWNQFFKSYGIQNIWVDTFNTHKYTKHIPNLLDGGDLMTQMSDGITSDSYHMSSWVDDDKRIQYLINKGLINPISLHPTKSGHQKISEIILKSKVFKGIKNG